MQSTWLAAAEQVDPDDRPAAGALLVRVGAALEEESTPGAQRPAPPQPHELMGNHSSGWLPRLHVCLLVFRADCYMSFSFHCFLRPQQTKFVA